MTAALPASPSMWSCGRRGGPEACKAAGGRHTWRGACCIIPFVAKICTIIAIVNRLSTWFGSITHKHTVTLQLVCMGATGDEQALGRQLEGCYPLFTQGPAQAVLEQLSFSCLVVLVAGCFAVQLNRAQPA